MPGRGNDAYAIESNHPRILEFRLDLGKGLHGMRRQMHSGEAEVIRMLQHVSEGDDPRPALRGVEPVAAPGIARDVGVALIPDVDAVKAVVEDRNPDEEQLQKKNAGQAVQK